MGKPYYAFDYMNRFQCTGPDCPDTCCTGWKINLYRKDYEKLHKLFTQKDSPMKAYESAIKKVPTAERMEENWGQLDFNPGGSCSMMDAGWCMLHRDFGEKMLPTVCATFPRIIYDFADRHEVSGRMSCPEVARLLLLDPKPPILGEFKADLPEVFESNPWPIEDREYYKKNLDAVSTCVRYLLSLERFTIEERNHFIVYLAKKIEPFYRLNIPKDPKSRLEKTLTRMSDDRFLQRTAENHGKADAHSDKVRDLVLSIVNARLKGPQFKRYNDLCIKVLGSYGKGVLNEQGQLQPQVKPEALWQVFLRLRSAVLARFNDKLTQYTTNFSVNFWYQHLYIGDTTVTAAARRLTLYLSVIRFLFISHPDVRRALEEKMSPEEQHGLLDETIVEVVQIFMKNIDANINLLKTLLDSMNNLGFLGVTELSALLKI